MKAYYVEGYGGWFCCFSRTKREAKSEGVKEYGNGMVKVVRVATSGEQTYYTTLMGKSWLNDNRY